MDANFAALEKQFSRDRTLPEAYLALSVFAAQVKCGHTYLNFFNQTKPIAAALFQNPDRLPFFFRWIDRQMIVTQDFTGKALLPRGTRVLAINNVESGIIVTRLMTIARADGSNDAKRIASLEVTGDSIYETFDIYYPLFFPLKSAQYTLSVIRPGTAKPETLVVAPMKTRQGVRPRDGVLFTWKYLPDGTAHLAMPTWALYNNKWDWKAWLNQHLDELARKNSPALVIDLRGNEGGNDIGNEILKRLVTSDIRISTGKRFVRYRQTPANLSPFLDTWDPSFKNWDKAAVDLTQPWPTAPAEVPYFALTRFDDDPQGDVIHPEGKPFRGKVYVLIGAENSSATFQFAQSIQQNKLGRLVGQPTGGNRRGINGGAFFFLRMPNSGLEIDLPLIAYFPSSPQPDVGLLPDFPVVRTAESIAQNIDLELAAVETIRTKMSRR